MSPVFRYSEIARWFAVGVFIWLFATACAFAVPTAVDDTYEVTEDRAFSAVSGPLVDLDFDGDELDGFDTDWLILDRIENENGRGDAYPVDGSGRVWNAPDFDTATSTISPWFTAPVPIQSGGIDGFSGLDDLLYGIDQAANGQNLVTTYLFRNSFTLSAAEAVIEDWQLDYLVDDGMAVYVNGTEVHRSELLPAGPLTTQSFTTTSVVDETAYVTAALDLGDLLVAGSNSIAVELHQASIESSDVGFNLSMGPAAAGGGAGSMTHVDDPFPAPFSTSAPDFSSGDIAAGGGFNGSAGAHIRVGGGPRNQNTVSSGALRLPITLDNPATLEISFRYRLLMSGGYESGEYSAVILEIGGNFVGTGANGDIFRMYGPDGQGNEDSGWRTFSTELSFPAGTHELDFGVYNDRSTTTGEVTDAWFDDIFIELVGGGTGGGVLGNDSGEGTGLTAAVASGPLHGSLGLNLDGTFTYVPESNFFGTDSFTYTAADNTGSSAPATVTLNILAVNDPPTIAARELASEEDSVLSVPVALGLRVLAADIEGDAFTFAIDADVSSGTLIVNPDGSFEYTPDDDFFGADSFTYVADDGTDRSLPATVSITVNPVNDPPSAEDDSYFTGENIPLVVSREGVALPLSVLSEDFDAGAGSQFGGVTNAELVSGFAGLGGDDGFSGDFLRNRTFGNPAGSTIITINNLPPHNRISFSFLLAVIDSWDGDRGGGDFFNVLVDGQSRFSHTFDNAGQGGFQSYSPVPGGELARSLDLGFSAGNLSGDSAYDMRNEPAFQDIVHTADSVTIEMFASGGGWDGGDDESWAIDNFRASVYTALTSELVATGSVWSYLDNGSDQGSAWTAPDYDDSGWASGAAQLGYGDGDEVTTVGFGGDANAKYPTTYFRHRFNVDDPSEFESLAIRLLHDDGAAVYINGTEVVRSNLAADAGFSDFTPATAVGESDFFDFTADLSVLVAGENIIAVEIHQISATSSDISFDLSLEGKRPNVLGVIDNDSDVDGPMLSVNLLMPPAGGVVDLNPDGSFIYTPGLNFEGSDSFTYTLSDGGLEDQATVSITVIPGANNFPVSSPDVYMTLEDTQLSVDPAAGLLANDSDPEGEILSAVLDSLPVNGSVIIAADGSFVYTPAPDFNGSDSFAYRAYDGVNESLPTIVHIEVSGINDPPSAVGDVFLTAPGTLLDVAVPGVLAGDFDIDGDSLQAELFSQAGSGVVILKTSGEFLFFPQFGFTGQTSFTYRVTDGLLYSDPATVVININSPPLARADSYELNEDEILALSPVLGLLANDSDSENDLLTAVLATPPVNGSIGISPDGAFTYIPDQDFNGSDSFTYTANDGLQDSMPVRVNLFISAINDPPVAGDDAYSVIIGQGITVPAVDGVLANDRDVENDPLSAVLIDYSGEGELSLNADGSLDYTPSPAFSGIDSFTYAVSSAGQTSAAATVELLVGPAADILIISEIMFHPASDNDAQEYIELYNVGAGPLPLQGWKLTSGVDFEFPAVIIPAGGYLIVAADPPVFEATYGAGPIVTGPWKGRLSNSGERIRLEDALGNEADDITYSDQGDWARRRAQNDGGEEGWQWDNPADGGGASLELINSGLSNKYGQNWVAGSSLTPGAANSVSFLNTPPLVSDVEHAPAIPRSDQAVTVNADFKDTEGDELSGVLHWRISTGNPGSFNVTSMSDDGRNGDGDAGDGTFAAQIPGQADGTVIEFYVEASDGENSRTWPAPSDNTGRQRANALFQFDDELYTGNQPIYRLVMTVEEDEDFRFGAFNAGSNAQKNVTLIARQGSDVDIRYQCGLRVRGAGSRGRNPRNNRLNIPRDRAWNGVTKINLNTQFIYLQLLGSRLSLASGIEAAAAKPVQLRHNGINRAEDNQNGRRYGSYLHVEAIDGDWADIHYALDPAGNVYSKGRPDVKWDVRYGGDGVSPNPGAYISDGWSKGSNESANQWDDLHQLFITMNNASGTGYLEQISGVVDVDQWARWFAYMTIVLSRETNLSNGTDDDYKLYSGAEDVRFKLIPHDFDTIFGLGDTSTSPQATLFPAITNFGGQTFPPLVPFFNDPRVVRMYYAHLRELLGTVFAKGNFDAAVVNFLDWLPQNSEVHENIVSFMDARRAHILSQIPGEFSVTSSLSASNGFPRTDDTQVTGLRGTIDASRTAAVRVNGTRVSLNARAGTWEAGGGIEELLLPAGATWRYLDDGSDQGVAWQSPGFDDSGWSQGPAQLGYSNNGNRGEVTTVSFGPDANDKHVTTYFRTTFELSGNSDYTNLVLRLLFDDGAAVYLNGVEVRRENLTANASFNELANLEVNGAAAFVSFNIPVHTLQGGTNTIAVEIHQARRESADLSFNAELIASASPPNLTPGINHIRVEAINAAGEVIETGEIDIWLDDGSTAQVSGELTEDMTWTAAAGPYLVSADIVVADGVTLTIEPGTSVYFANDTRMTVRGRLLAEGTPERLIIFAQQPGTAGGWEGVYFENTLADNRMAYLVQDGSDAGSHSIGVSAARLALRNVSWTGTEETILELSHPRIEVTGCAFPATSGQDVIHGTDLNGGDSFNLEGNVFQGSSGYNDIINFSGARRPGPIIYVVGNIFNGVADDCLDLDGIDAHIEGNLFTNVHTDDPDRDSSSNAISADGGSHLTVVRNLFNGVDHALLLRNNSDALFENNTVINATIGAINFDETNVGGAIPGLAITMRGNIFWNNTAIFENQFATEEGEDDPEIIADLNIISAEHHGLGSGNIAANPLFTNPGGGVFLLTSASPAIGSGINGLDMGYAVAAGASISGEPRALGRDNSARLAVHVPGISGIEAGSFVSEYRWRLDGGQWSVPVPLANAIELSGLVDGSHFVEVVGKDSAGFWQAEGEATPSDTWVVDSTLSRLLINEVLADNGGVYDHEGSFPDFIEIWNDSPDLRDVSTMVLSDNDNPASGWSFPPGTLIPAGGYLLVFANAQDATSGLHSGFGIDNDGEAVFLFDAPAKGGGLVDSLEFGFQLAGRSIGRERSEKGFAAMIPTPGSVNTSPIALGLPDQVVINEWLATSGIVYDNDFLELYNPGVLPVLLEGMMCSDDPNHRPGRHTVGPLSFIEAGGFVKFIADDDESQGPSHLNFNLSKLIEQVGLFNSSGVEIDRVQFSNAMDNTSAGRMTDGNLLFTDFSLPTPGFSNGTDLSAEALILQNLRITELMYNPPGGSNWEFIRVENVGTAAIGLGNVEFDQGIDFHFPDVALSPGEGAYIVRDTASFIAHNGGGLTILGEYEGKLDNGGERLRLEIASLGAGILDFEYDDDWYPGTDGDGQLLQIINPVEAPATWDFRASWQPVGGDNTMDYSDWVTISFGGITPGITGKSDDPDGDGMVNLLEFVFRLDPKHPDAQSALPQASLGHGNIALTYTTVHLPDGVTVTPELANDLALWSDAGQRVTVEMLADDGIISIYRATLNELPGSIKSRFMRLRVDSP